MSNLVPSMSQIAILSCQSASRRIQKHIYRGGCDALMSAVFWQALWHDMFGPFRIIMIPLNEPNPAGTGLEQWLAKKAVLERMIARRSKKKMSGLFEHAQKSGKWGLAKMFNWELRILDTHVRQTRDWFVSNDDANPFSFSVICESLELQPSVVGKIKRTVALISLIRKRILKDAHAALLKAPTERLWTVVFKSNNRYSQRDGLKLYLAPQWRDYLRCRVFGGKAEEPQGIPVLQCPPLREYLDSIRRIQ